MNGRGRRVIMVLGFALGLTFLWLALRNTDFGEIWGALRRANPLLVFPFLATLVLLYWFRAWRWSILLRPLDQKVASKDVFPAVMIGYASNVVLPPPFSDFVRMFVACRKLRVPSAAVLTTIVLERVFDLLTIVVLLGFALWLAPKPSGELAMAGTVGGAVGLLVLSLAFLYVTWADSVALVFDRVFALFPKRIESFLSTQAALVTSGLMALKNARCILSVTLITIAQWLVTGFGIDISLRALQIDVHPSVAFIVLAFTFVGVTLPTTPGAVGTIQLSFALALAPVGVAAGDAVAASIFWHAIAYCFVVVLGAYFFVRLGYNFREIRDHAHGGSLVRSVGMHSEDSA